ncbi:endonuclease domain-containing protein [Roseivirga sp. E12]|uniref:endonuclease domain-containing protein n=1 Tax=Roseivirga sp. E12 TaxID=2819237 RepID=UPI00351C29D4
MGRIHNRLALKERRKHLRNNGTSAEATLWTLLSNKQLEGRKFRRQHSIKNYIVDFYCPSEKLIVELDGDVHFSAAGVQYDRKRDEELRELGFKIIRIENEDVFLATMAVLDKIKNAFTTPDPS